MNLNHIFDIRNSDFVHEFLNNETRVRKEIEEKGKEDFNLVQNGTKSRGRVFRDHV